MNRTYLYLGVFLGLRKGVMFSAKTMNITAIFVIAISTKSFAIVTFSVKTITIITIIAISLPIKAIDIKPAPIEPIAVITLCIKTFNVKTIMVISVSIVTINVIAPSIKTIIIKAVNVISVIDRHKPQPLDNKECLYSFYHVMYRQINDFLHKKISTVLYIVSMQKRSLFKYQWFDEPVTLTPSMIDALYHNTHGIIDQFIGLCMYLNLDYISSKKRPTVDESYINKTAKKHYRGVQQLLDELDDPLKEQKRQKIVDDANRKLDNLLQETKQADFATTILEKGAEADKNLSLKRKVIRNIRVVTLDYSENKIAACVDEVLHTAPDSDEAVLIRAVMKLLAVKKTTTSTKKTPSKNIKLKSQSMVKYIME